MNIKPITLKPITPAKPAAPAALPCTVKYYMRQAEPAQWGKIWKLKGKQEKRNPGLDYHYLFFWAV